jgi:hypothetical protein
MQLGGRNMLFADPDQKIGNTGPTVGDRLGFTLVAIFI